MSDYYTDDEIKKIGFASPETQSVSSPGYYTEDEINKIGFAPIPKEEISKTESALRGLGQGATLGFGDEIVGGLDTAADVMFGGKKLSDVVKLYEQYRDIQRARNEKAKKANPLSYMGGEVGGGVATAFIPGLNIAKGASLAKTAGTAALAGGLGAIGTNEGSLTDPENLKQLGKDVAISSTIGAGTGAIAKGLVELPTLAKKSNVLGDIVESFKRGRAGEDLASSQAAKAAAEDLYGLGKNVSQEVKAIEQEAGRQYGKALEQSVDLTGATQKELNELKNRLVYQLSTERAPNRIAEAQKMLNEVEGMLGKTKVNLDKEAVKSLYPESAPTQSKRFGPKEVQNVKEALKEQSFLGKNPDSTATNKALASIATDYSGKMAQILKKNVPGLEEASNVLGASKRMDDLLNLSNEMIQSDALKNKAKTAEFLKRLEQEGIKGEAAQDIISELRQLANKTGSNNLKALLGTNAEEIARTYALTQKAQKEGLNVFSRGALTVGGPNVLARSPVGPIISGAFQAATSKQLPGIARGVTQTMTDSMTPAAKGNVYAYSPEELQPLILTLASSPRFSDHAQKLQTALEQGDFRKKDSILFSLQQNPDARMLLGWPLEENRLP